MSTTWRLPLDRGQEDVEDNGNKHKDYVAHNAEPETRVFEELLVVGTEEDIADSHSSDDASEMGHKGDLAEGGGVRRQISHIVSLNTKSSWGRVLSNLMEMWGTPQKKAWRTSFDSQNKCTGGDGALQWSIRGSQVPPQEQSSPSGLLLPITTH